jgi:hypothetical protein
MGKVANAIAKAEGRKCWNCGHSVHFLTNKQSHLGGEWGLICNNCCKDLTEWYLLKGFVKVTDVVNAERKARTRYARNERNRARSRQGKLV